MPDDLDDAIAGLSKALQGASLQACTQAAANVFLNQAKSLIPVDSGVMRDHLEVISHHSQNSAASAVQVANSAKGGAQHAAIFLEYGTQHMQAHPFMRPAFESKKTEAAQAFERALQNTLKAIT